MSGQVQQAQTGTRVTAVLASYNHARHLGEAIRSLLDQTRSFDEILIIDDASSDDSVELARSLVADHPGARVLVNERNLGIAKVNNRGLKLASGDYVGFYAADDLYHARLVERLAGALDRHPQAALAGGYDEWIDEQGKPIGQLRRLRPKRGEFYRADEVESYFARFGSFLSGCACLYRTERLRTLGGFDASLGAFQDGLVRELLALRDGLCFVPEVLGFWRRSRESYSANAARNVDATLEALSAAEAVLADDPLGTGIAPPGRRRLLERCRYTALSGLLGNPQVRPEQLRRILGPDREWLARPLCGLAGHVKVARGIAALVMVPNELLGDVRARLSS